MSNKRIYFKTTAVFVASLVFLYASSKHFSHDGKTDEIVIGIPNPPLSLSSFRIRDGVSTLIGRQIHKSLLRFDDQTGNIVGDLAESVKLLPTENTIRFKLKKGLKFHDESPLDCRSTKESIDLLIHSTEQLPLKFPNDTITRCEPDGEFSIQFSKSLHPLILERLASPASSISKANGLVGCGPFKLLENSQDRIILEEAGSRKRKRLIFKIDETEALVKGFKEGLIHDLSYLGLLSGIKRLGLTNCKIQSGLSPTSFWLSFNTRTNSLNRLDNRKKSSNESVLGSKTQKFSRMNIRSRASYPWVSSAAEYLPRRFCLKAYEVNTQSSFPTLE